MSVPGLFLLDFYKEDKKALEEKLAKIEKLGEAIIDLVCFGVAAPVVTVAAKRTVLEPTGIRETVEPVEVPLLPQAFVKTHNPVDVFSDQGEPIFVSLVSKLAMHSISASAKALELEETVLGQVQISNPQQLAALPPQPQAIPSPALERKMEELKEKERGEQPWYKRLASALSKPFTREEEEFKLFIEEAKRSLLDEYYGSKDLIRHQGLARRERELSNLRLKVSETVPEMVRRTHEFILTRIRQIEEYVAQANRGGG